MSMSRPTLSEIAHYVALLERAGLVEVRTDEQGHEAYALTADGVRVGNMLAMVEGDDAATVLEGLLGNPGSVEPLDLSPRTRARPIRPHPVA
jgi:hypothetical protein